MREEAKMKSVPGFGRKLTLLALACCLAHGPASANPENPLVVHGRADIANRGNTLTITNTPGAIINWQSFSIRPGEITRFIQQGGDSAVLNRIVGQDPSQIFGALESNGRVFLVNPNGILFAPGARVDVNGLVASTLQLRNEDFLAGARNFTAGGGTPGGIVNQGTITTPRGGQVYLIAPSVENSGLITSPQGKIVLAAGRHVRLADSADPSLHVVVSAPEDQAINLGQVLAQSGKVGIYGALVNQRGVVNADSAVAGANGKIVLRSSRQTLLESGSVTRARGAGAGGDIHILGEHVGLTGDAVVDASGETGGGTVLIGGDFQGANAAIPNAAATFVGPQARVQADAITSGNGGRIIVWANDATRMFGRLSARGGAHSGNGGFAEVSGGNYLEFRGRADLRASHGAAGTLLLDPNDITIQNGPAPATDVGQVDGPPVQFLGGPASSVLTVADLEAQLGMSNVTVSTAGGVGGPLGGRITVADAVSWSGARVLTLSADNGIAINGAISGPGDGTLLLDSRGGTITQTAPIEVTYLGITSVGDVNLGTSTNSVTNLAAHIGDATHPNANFSFLNGQALNIHDVRGINGIVIDVSGGSSGGVVSLRTTSGPITQSTGAVISANALFAHASSVELREANPTRTIAGQATGTGTEDLFAYVGGNGVTVGTVGGFAGIQTNNGAVSLTANTGDISMTAPVNAAAGTVTLSALAGAVGGTVNAGGLDVSALNGIGLTTQLAWIVARNSGGSQDIAVSNGGALDIRGVTQSGSGATRLTAHGALTVTGSVTSTAGGAITLEAGPTGSVSDQLSIAGSVATTGSVVLRAGDAINITGTVSGTVTQQPFLNTPAPPPPPPAPPTIDQCIANPTLEGCSSVLPSIGACITAPQTAGCHVVLPTLSQCVSRPADAGCSVVLPTLAQCIAAPTTPACNMILPSLSRCVASPATPGCSAVLPTLTQCTTNPTLHGCAVVLPSLAACIGRPVLPGCAVVLPSLAACITTPTRDGCAVVLPSLPACITSPSMAGCAVVLPSLATCIAIPTLHGCAVVLPRLDQCTAIPTLAGCHVVLPSLPECVVAPTRVGCSVVLPTLAQCISNSAAMGCGIVLPGLGQCTLHPTLLGCSVVLPPLTLCIAIPALPGCTAVLPSLSACSSAPGITGCSAVLPALATCTTNPSMPECALILPPAGPPTGPSLGTSIDHILSAVLTGTAPPTKPGMGKDTGTGPNSPLFPGEKYEKPAVKLYCN
jgi:filamentous hemagglutinin family protein